MVNVCLPVLRRVAGAVHGLHELTYYIAVLLVFGLLRQLDVDLACHRGVEEGPLDVHDHQPLERCVAAVGRGQLGHHKLEGLQGRRPGKEVIPLAVCDFFDNTPGSYVRRLAGPPLVHIQPSRGYGFDALRDGHGPGHFDVGVHALEGLNLSQSCLPHLLWVQQPAGAVVHVLLPLGLSTLVLVRQVVAAVL